MAEAVLSLGLAVVAILTVVGLALTALRGNQKASDQSVATAIAAKELEEFVYGLPPAADPFWGPSAVTNPYAVSKTTLSGTEFETRLTLTDLTTLSGAKMVSVNVTWGSGVQGRAGYGTQVVGVSRMIYAPR